MDIPKDFDSLAFFETSEPAEVTCPSLQELELPICWNKICRDKLFPEVKSVPPRTLLLSIKPTMKINSQYNIDRDERSNE